MNHAQIEAILAESVHFAYVDKEMVKEKMFPDYVYTKHKFSLNRLSVANEKIARESVTVNVLVLCSDHKRKVLRSDRVLGNSHIFALTESSWSLRYDESIGFWI